MRKWTQKKKRKPINKLRILNFFENLKRTKKMRKRTPKKRKPNWKFKTFFDKWKQTQKQEERDPKKRGNGSTNWGFITFLKTGNWPKNKKKQTQNNGKQIKCKYSKTDPKYLEIPQHFSVLEGFLIIYEKEGNRPKFCWILLCVETFP